MSSSTHLEMFFSPAAPRRRGNITRQTRRELMHRAVTRRTPPSLLFTAVLLVATSTTTAQVTPPAASAGAAAAAKAPADAQPAGLSAAGERLAPDAGFKPPAADAGFKSPAANAGAAVSPPAARDGPAATKPVAAATPDSAAAATVTPPAASAGTEAAAAVTPLVTSAGVAAVEPSAAATAGAAAATATAARAAATPAATPAAAAEQQPESTPDAKPTQKPADEPSKSAGPPKQVEEGAQAAAASDAAKAAPVAAKGYNAGFRLGEKAEDAKLGGLRAQAIQRGVAAGAAANEAAAVEAAPPRKAAAGLAPGADAVKLAQKQTQEHMKQQARVQALEDKKLLEKHGLLESDGKPAATDEDSAARNLLNSESEEAALAARAAKNAASDGGAKTDDNPLCGSWAQSGECIRNPQYMWAVCSLACGSLSYSDNDPSCAGWAESGECEKNSEFMLAMCNASCVKSVRRGGAERGGPHANPNLAAGAGGPEQTHRARTFFPIFVLIAGLLATVVALQYVFAASLAAQTEAAEDAWARKLVVLQRQLPWLAGVLGGLDVDALGRWMICVYFLNEGFTVVQTNPQLASILSATHMFNGDGVWQEHVAWVDAANLLGAVAAALAAFHVRLLPCAFLMLSDIVVDSYLLVVRIAWQWLFGRGLYINELMAKKFSLLGCVAMLIAVTVQKQEKKSSFGMLLEAAGPTTKVSLALLLSRLLIAVLFLFVGLSELHRLLFQPFTPYLPGDGHDVVWPKAVELLLAIPFTLGFQMTLVSRLLACSLVLEAFYAWSWWTTPGDSFSFAHHRRAIHYREHFVTNIATAGGLLLLQKIGGGKYTVDELLKKKD